MPEITTQNVTTILWRRLDRPGHESARLVCGEAENVLSGCAVFVHESGPCRLDYRIACDLQWRTRFAAVSGWIGDKSVQADLTVDAQGRWYLGGAEVHDVEGCLDIDLNFSPSTNLLPIRRLAPPVGGKGTVRAAWLRFPSLSLEPLEQMYQRTAGDVYRYESGGGSFVAWLRVNKAGFVTEYPSFWRAES